MSRNSYSDLQEVKKDFDSKGWKLITIYSSEGVVFASLNTGKVVYVEVEDEDSYLHKIRLFDFQEWRNYWKQDQVPDELDILDLRYSNKDFSYEEPVLDFRKEIQLVKDQ